jgi:hypothetical protein
MDQAVEHATTSAMLGRSAAGDIETIYVKIAKRIMPFLVLLFVVAWLDRVNVGFAKLQMVKDLGFSEAVYGFGAGIFFFGYVLFEIPSNLFLQRIGARKTIARITILWGITSIGMMFVKTATWFYILRFLLGAFDQRHRSGIITFSRGSREKNIALMEYLLDRRILTSVRYTSGVGGVRISNHFFNTIEDLDYLLEQTGNFLRANR